MDHEAGVQHWVGWGLSTAGDGEEKEGVAGAVTLTGYALSWAEHLLRFTVTGMW